MSEKRIDPSSLQWYEQRPVWQSSALFAEAAKSIEGLKAQFASTQLSLNPTSGLARLMNRAAGFANAPELERGSDELFLRSIVEGQFLDRIARACAVIRGMPNERQYLARIKTGSVDIGARAPSPAKDTLFELEFFAILRENSLEAELCEPDVVVESPLGRVDIACKRIYSRSNAESQISKAIRQLDKFNSYKVLALCLDDLLPPYSVIYAETPEHAAAMLDAFASEFLAFFERKIYRYIAHRRVSFIAVSTTAPVSYVGEDGHIGAQTQLFLFMPDPKNGMVSDEARHLCDSLFLHPGKRWEPR